MVTQQRLMRSNSDKIIGGVCGGLARYFGIDPVVVRLVMALLIFAGGFSLLIYPILWLVMPSDAAPSVSFQEQVRSVQYEAQAVGQQAAQQMRAVFDTPHYDPQTGQPIQQPAVDRERRNKVLGAILFGAGAMMLAGYFGSSQLVLAALVIVGGIYLLRRS